MKKIIKRTSLFLLEFFTVMLILSTLLFFIKVGISRYHLIISFVITCIIEFFFHKKDTKKEYAKFILISLGIIVLSTLVSTYLFDRSSDGNTYHKDAIGVMKEGFNPVYEESYDFIVKRDGNDDYSQYNIWTDHYAKANWILESNFYALTNNIESAKAVNFISMYIAFGVLFTVLISKLSLLKTSMLSLIAVVNPVTGAQLLTFYNDQLVYFYLIIAVSMLIKLDKNIKHGTSWYIYIMSFIILSNMKFNGMGYLMVFSFLFVCRYLYKAFKSKNLLFEFKRLCLIFIPLFIVSFLIIGFPTYVKNTLDHNNPVFPLYDPNGEDIITLQQPEDFVNKTPIEKLFIGTFSKVTNLRYDRNKTELKVPFFIYKEEIVPACSFDLRIGGWGILYSGLLIVSIIILIVMYKKYKKESFILYTLGITTILLLVMSESWWARYTPHFYFFILLGLYILYKYNKDKIFNIIFTILILGNTALPFFGNTIYTLKNSITINNKLNSLKGTEIVINNHSAYGALYNLKDYNIKFTSNDNIEGNELYYSWITYVKKD